MQAKAECIRKVENWTNIKNYHRFDKSTFDPKKMSEEIASFSPKLETLLNKIDELDKEDMDKDNRTYKHFIFSDVKKGGYGAKIVASGMIARGYHHCFQTNGSVDIPKPHKDHKTLGLLSSTALYNTPMSQKKIKQILKIYNERPTNIYGEQMRFIIFDSGFKEGIDLFDVKYVHIFEEQNTSADLTQAVGRATRSCGQKGLDFVPNKGWELHVYQYHTVFEDGKRLFDSYLQYKGVDLNEFEIRENVEKLAIFSAVDHNLNYYIHNKYKDFDKQSGGNDNLTLGCVKGKCGKRSTKSIPFSLQLMETVYKSISKSKKSIKLPTDYKGLNSKEKRQFFCDKLKEDQEFCKKVNEKYDVIKSKTTKPTKKLNDIYDLPFEKFQTEISKMYRQFRYLPLVIKNNCNTSFGNDRVVKLTESQSFITNYFTPQSNNKGLLVWHSVGTGKTCTAISVKSFLFEKQDYHILWVTRSTLKDDIWKNMFDKVCDHVIRDKIENGAKIPVNPEQVRKYVSNRFLPPISYRQLSNILQGKNEIAKLLIERNGSKDMLKKTLIIIDEAHKLYGNDLVGMEKPNMNIIEKAIHNSYNVSGNESARVLLMTATPIADDTNELFQLINLIQGDKAKKLPIEMNEFKQQYINSNTNDFSEDGKHKFQNNLKGLISYLDRRKDPRNFVQPTFYKVAVPLSSAPYEQTKEYCMKEVDKQMKECSLSENIHIKFNQEMNEAESRLNDVKMRLKTSKKSSELKEEQAKLKAYIKNLKDEYKSSIQTNKKCMKEVDKKQKACAQLEKNQPTQKETLVHDCKIDLAS